MRTILKRARKFWRLCQRSFFHKQHVIHDYISGFISLRGEIKRTLAPLGMELVSFRPLGPRRWHDGTSVFVAKTKGGNQYFVKKSGNLRAVRAEIEAIAFWEARNAGNCFRTCRLLTSSCKGKKGFVIESFLPHHSLADSAFVATLSQARKLALVRRLMETVRCFQQASFVHSDFTPKNIFVGEDGAIFITDFEFSCFPGSNLDRVDLPKDLIEDIGSFCALGIGVADDAYSLLRIAKFLLPDLLKIDMLLWREINLMIGHVQYDLFRNQLLTQ